MIMVGYLLVFGAAFQYLFIFLMQLKPLNTLTIKSKLLAKTWEITTRSAVIFHYNLGIIAQK